MMPANPKIQHFFLPLRKYPKNFRVFLLDQIEQIRQTLEVSNKNNLISVSKEDTPSQPLPICLLQLQWA